MSDGVIKIDVELNEREFRASLLNMGSIVESGSQNMIRSIDALGHDFAVLPSNIERTFGVVPDLIDGLIADIASKNEVMAETGQAFFGSLADRLPEAVSEIAEEIPQIALEISDALNEGKELMADAGFNLLTALTDNLPIAVGLLAQAPREIVETLVNVFTEQLSQFHEVGVNIVHGVWAGISSMAAWLSSQVSGFFSGIVGGITNFLGINSPSTLFRDKIGRNIALGIGVGIAEEMPRIARDMRGYMNAIAMSANKINVGAFSGKFAFNNAARRIQNADFKANIGETSDMANVNITIEPTGDMRGFFEYLSMNIKRADYLSGGAT